MVYIWYTNTASHTCRPGKWIGYTVVAGRKRKLAQI